MLLEFIRDRRKDLPVPPYAADIEHLTLWHCNFRTLAGLTAFRNLARLEVATWPDSTLEVLGTLTRLAWLRIIHLPKVTDLEPLAKLRALRSLSLATLPSWDSGGKVTRVASLEPLAGLPLLQRLELFGVVPIDRSLAPLERAPALSFVRVSKYRKVEVDRYYRATGLLSPPH